MKFTKQELESKGAVFYTGDRCPLATTGVGEWWYKWGPIFYFGPYKNIIKAQAAYNEVVTDIGEETEHD